jgi:hypothetical protein
MSSAKPSLGKNVSMRQGDPAARCTSCDFAWRSAAMADGLRAIGSCPRCGGELEFAADAPVLPDEEAAVPDVDPARVMGVPRRPDA